MPSCRSLFVGVEAGISTGCLTAETGSSILDARKLPSCRSLFVVVEAGIETGGWKPEPRVSRASINTSIDNLKRNWLLDTSIDNLKR
ncbi:MAG: hypothetical protein ABIL62_01630, partial [Planctomycetota bacterium]